MTTGEDRCLDTGRPVSQCYMKHQCATEGSKVYGSLINTSGAQRPVPADSGSRSLKARNLHKAADETIAKLQALVEEAERSEREAVVSAHNVSKLYEKLYAEAELLERYQSKLLILYRLWKHGGSLPRYLEVMQEVFQWVEEQENAGASTKVPPPSSPPKPASTGPMSPSSSYNDEPRQPGPVSN